MRAIRIAASLLLVIVLATALAACAKKSDREVSSAMPEENPATVAESPVPEAPTPEPPATTANQSSPATPKPPAKSTPSKSTPAVPAAETRTVSLPAGDTLQVELITPIHTATSNVGDKVEAILLAPVMTADGTVIARQGSMIRGEVANLTRASKSKSEEDRASVQLAFTSIETVDGEKSLTATVTNAEGMQAGGTGKRDALAIGGGAVVGAILGKIIGKDTKGAAIGAVAGAAVGAGAMMASKGHELDVPAGSKISLRVEQPITIVAR